MDEEGFTEWAAGAQRRLLRSAYLLTGDLHRAQDLVQEALVKVALRWPRLRDGNPTAYARTIIVRDNISWWRRRREAPALSKPSWPRPRPTPTPRSSCAGARPGSPRGSARSWCCATSTTCPSGRRPRSSASAVGTVKSQNADALARLREGAPELLDLIGEDPMTDLRLLLELATDEVESPDLARASLATARRRRTWRRGVLASGSPSSPWPGCWSCLGPSTPPTRSASPPVRRRRRPRRRRRRRARWRRRSRRV